MSAVFEGILCYVSVDNVQDLLKEDESITDLSLDNAIIDETILVIFRNDSRAESAFTEKMNDLAEKLSVPSGSCLLVRYSDYTGHRSSSLYVQGKCKSEYGTSDEIWVMLDDDGNPMVNGPHFHTSELDQDSDMEYETVENAIQLGLKDFGAGNWKALHFLMTQ